MTMDGKLIGLPGFTLGKMGSCSNFGLFHSSEWKLELINTSAESGSSDSPPAHSTHHGPGTLLGENLEKKSCLKTK